MSVGVYCCQPTSESVCECVCVGERVGALVSVCVCVCVLERE